MALEEKIMQQIRNDCISYLDLKNTNLEDAQVKDLAQALKANRSITTVDLSGNQIGDPGIRYLAEVLKNNQCIATLRLSGNQIGADGANILAEALKCNQTIISLNLSNNQLRNIGAKYLANGLKNNNHIIDIDLSGNQIGAAGSKSIAEALQNQHSIAYLNLNCNEVGNAGLKHLTEIFKSNKSISDLYLDDNRIGDVGVKYLAETLKNNRFIETLHISNNQIGADGANSLAEALQCNNTITSLDLSGNHIGASGVKYLAEGLKNNHKIAILNINSCQIGDVGAKDLAEALKNHHSITILSLANNEIGDDGVKHLAEALRSNQSIYDLNLAVNRIKATGMWYIADILKNNKNITILNLGINLIGDDGAKHCAEALKKNHTVAVLNLCNNEITATGVKYLAEVLKNHQSVKNLNLNFNKIGDDGVKLLSEALKNNKSITDLYLSSNEIGNTGMKYLAKTLENNHFISTLNIANNQIESDGAKHLAQCLKANHTISSLNLHSNKIGNSGAKDLAAALKNNKTILNLNLNFNQIGDNGVMHLAESLKWNNSITNIYLQVNQIKDAGARYLIETLKTNQSLTILNIHNMGNFEEAEMTFSMNTDLLEILSSHNTIEFTRENITIDSERGGKMLTRNYEFIHPDCNKICQDLAKQLAEALQINKGLKEKAKVLLNIGRKKEDETKTDICIPRKHLFAVPGGDDQFHYHDQATIKHVSELIRDGNNSLQHLSQKGLLILGGTGAGKSTLANVFAKRKLQAIFNDQIGKLVIDAMTPLKDIIIGHEMNSETGIPNRCFIEDKGLTIWDCPGYNDTDTVQQIANSFYVKRIIETTKELKFVLVIVEADLTNNRGNNFLGTLSSFISGFEDVKSIEDSISLVITQVPNGTKIEHIRKSIENIVAVNKKASNTDKEIVKKLRDSIHVFHKPEKEGELDVNSILAQIDLSSKYSEIKSDMVKISISKEAMKCSSHLLNVTYSNLNKLLDVIIAAICDATKCLSPRNIFIQNYTFIKDWIPSSICYNSLQEHKEEEYFLELDFLSQLQKVLCNNQILMLSDVIIILCKAIDVFAEYAEPGDVLHREMIQSYGYCLQQQFDYASFFASVCKAKLPDHQKAAELITACHLKITDTLRNTIISLHIDDNKLNTEYYIKALKYINYHDHPRCRKLEAIAYCSLGSIVEKNNEREAIVYFSRAVDADSHLTKVYEKLGKLLLNKGNYAEAIDCYKVVNNAFMIEECFSKWLKNDKGNPEILLRQAEYFESKFLFEKAKQYYYYAIGLSQDNDFKTAALKRVGRIMMDASANGHDIIARAENQDFYNFDLVENKIVQFLH